MYSRMEYGTEPLVERLALVDQHVSQCLGQPRHVGDGTGASRRSTWSARRCASDLTGSSVGHLLPEQLEFVPESRAEQGAGRGNPHPIGVS